MSGEWLPIRYRDFYDVPRAVVVEHEGRLYLFDCLFDYDLDDYEDDYTIYLIPEDLRDVIDTMSWTDLGHRSEKVGVVATAFVEFDETKRKAISDQVFERLGPDED